MKKIFIENGEGDKVGYVAKAPKLMVPSYDGTMVDFYTIAEGTKFDIMLDDERQGGDVWDPSNEGTLLALRLIANGKYQTVKVL